VLSRNRKIFAVSSLVLNLFASQIGEFFLPHPVVGFIIKIYHEEWSPERHQKKPVHLFS